jgi:hypothetical protein
MIDIWLWTRDGRYCGQRIEDRGWNFEGILFEEVSPGVGGPGPAFRLTPEDAQILMNSLWECGLRPLAAAGSAGQLDATRAHLADMRLIALTKLGIKT